MKSTKTATPTDFRVWCERCCVRVAPSEEQTVVHGKTYHPRCYLKLAEKPGVDSQAQA
jgi:hypothetical protein